MVYEESLSFFGTYTQRRYILAYMCHLGCAIMYIVRTNLSVAIVPMSREFDWDSTKQGIVLSSFFYGYIATQLLGGALSKRFPAHSVFGGAIGLSAVLSLITPLAKGNLTAIICIRTLEGLLLGVTFPAMMATIAVWAPPLERSTINMISIAGMHVGTVAALVGSGYLNDSLGYESIFYVFGTIGVMWYISWLFIIRESPQKDPWISDREKLYILETTGSGVSEQSKNLSDVPWLRMFTSIPVLAIVFAHFGYTWGAYTLITQMPTFLSDTIGLELGSTGLLACLPYITTGVLSVPAGALTDFLIRRKILTVVTTRKLFTSGGYLVQTVFMLCAAYFLTPVGSVLCLTIAVGFQTVSQCGYGINYFDLAPQYAGVIFGFTNTFGTLSGIISPHLTGLIVQNQSADEWKIVFYIAAAIYLFTALIYVIFASATVQDWAKVKKSTDNEQNEEKS
ncbi:vesicular glutamate transporter 3-like [Culicoides brevitarsis]|uniref:vesicular glutamate transporter 3-like n=1 Tax=Culicoides brevitarsis TaxID=469753 RepID=UPI00307C3863